jgi:hypothetical protein
VGIGDPAEGLARACQRVQGGAVGRRLDGELVWTLLDDEVDVGAAESEGVDARATGLRAARPGAGGGERAQRAAVEAGAG